MKKSVTLNDFFLLSHIETDEWLDQQISRTDFASECSGNEINGFSIKNNYSKTLTSPDKRITDNIMGYSRALYLLKTKDGECFNILMN
jgi:hypothetical protein